MAHVFDTTSIDTSCINKTYIGVIIAKITEHIARIFIGISSVRIAIPEDRLTSGIIPNIGGNVRIRGRDNLSIGASRRGRSGMLKRFNDARRAKTNKSIIKVMTSYKGCRGRDMISN